jgi:hypothetical protein
MEMPLPRKSTKTEDVDSHRLLGKAAQRTRGFSTFPQARRFHYFRKRKTAGPTFKNRYFLTEAIHFPNDIPSIVASLRSLDALPRNRWML